MTNEKEAALLSIKKARSMLDKLTEMLNANEYCIDIMQQNLATIGLLKSAQQQLMANHLHSCFSKAMASKQEKRKSEMIEEILKVSKMASK